MNQFATPGLGTLLARRFVEGAGQLGVFLVGFVMFVIWFVDELRQYYDLMFNDRQPHVRHWLVFVGVGLCAVGWFWSLVTSFSMMREAKRHEELMVQKSAAPPPVLGSIR